MDGAHLHCWNVSHILRMLHEIPSAQLVISRAIRFHHHITTTALPNPYMDSLIDDFMCYSINSYQNLMVMEFDNRRITESEKMWFELNTNARKELWLLLQPMSIQYAGSMINYARTGNTIFLFIP